VHLVRDFKDEGLSLFTALENLVSLTKKTKKSKKTKTTTTTTTTNKTTTTKETYDYCSLRIHEMMHSINAIFK
jgi:hypothetical protein